MIKKILIFLIFSFLLLNSCIKNQKEKINPVVPIVNVDRSFKNIKFDLKDISKIALFIQLETNKDCLLRGISKVEVFNNRIYIYDSGISGELYCFDLQGKFLFKVGSKGNGPGEYVSLLDFTIDKLNKCLWLGDDAKKILKYDLEGNFIAQYNIDFSIKNLCLVSEKESIMAIRLGFYKEKNFSFIIYSINDNKILYKKESENISITRSVSGRTISKSKENILYTEPFCDTIFTITKEGLLPYCVIDFGRNKIPKELFDKQFRELISQLNNPDNMYAGLVMNPNEDSELLFFTYRFSGKSQSAIYSITSDKGIYFNDISFMGKSFNVAGTFFHVQNDNQFIAFLPANLLAEGSKSLQGDKRQGYGSYSDITKLIPNLDEEDNPIMVMGEFNLDHLFQ